MSGQIRMHIFQKSICDKDMDIFRKTWYQSVDITPRHINTIVRMAAEKGFVEGLRFIVQQRGVDSLDLGGYHNVFHVACKAGQAEIVKFLLTLEKFDKNTTGFNSQFWDCLSKSSETNNIEVISVLLGSGKVDINKASQHGVSLLFQAIEDRKKRLADYLIQQGADVTFVGKWSWLGNISCTCLSAIKIPSLLPDLLKRGGNANDVNDKSGQSILMLAIENNADRKTIEEIIRAGANLSWEDNSRRTAFSLLKSIDQFFGVLDADVTIEDIEKQYKFSTLEFILKRSENEKKNILLLLEKGANPNFYKDGETSLLTKACEGPFRNEECVRILLQHGANPNHIDEKGLTVLQNTLKQGSRCKTAHYLLDVGAKPDHCLWSMMKVASNDDCWLKLGRRLLESGADPNEMSVEKQSILSAAIERNLIEFSEELVRYGANTNFIDFAGRSPLDYACQLGMDDREFRCLRALLKYPANLDISNVIDHIGALGRTSPKTYTYLNHCSFRFDVRGVFNLFIAGADLMKKQTGTFPLQCLRSLASYGLFESIRFLMRCGWNIDTEKSWLREFENEKQFNFSFNVDEYSYTPHITDENRKSLTAVLNEIENEPKTLQNVCRLRIRKQLSNCGHSILPLIEDLTIPAKLKSFLKFEDHESPEEEEVVVNAHRNDSNYHYYDDSDYYDDYYDNDDYNYESDDHVEMIFDTESDEWVPIWW